MTQSNNKVIISAAGSGKTTYIVDQAIKNDKQRALILTYTLDNLEQIKRGIIRTMGVIPSNITVQSWYSFLLNECVRPYQNFVYNATRIESIYFVNGISTRYVKKTNIPKYYLKDGKKIYTDKMSEFICICNDKSSSLVIDRLERMYDSIYIDEVQDLSGYDFDLIDLFFYSKLNIVLVGDNRQATYFTNCSAKFKCFKGQNIINLFKDWEKKGKCQIEYRSDCYRCNQEICDFADLLYPDMPKTRSCNHVKTGHDGLFLIKSKDMINYVKKYNPKILRYDKRTDTAGLESFNFGASKGLTFDRVLIVPNGPISKYIKSCDIKHVEKSKPKFYVAITRAKYSVAFVYDNQSDFDILKEDHIRF